MHVKTGNRFDARLNWRAAALLGLLVSIWSTLVSQFFAGRIGRDAVVDWMVVAAIPLRDAALQMEPGWGIILGGILFHQWADFSWAMVFFGLLGRYTAGLAPRTLLALCVPWAIFTSALEWLVLVPLLPFWQPVFTLNQPYWIGLLVHVTSASLYPLFPWLRDRVAGRPSPHRRFAAAWGGLAAGGLLTLAVLALLGVQGRELRHFGGDAAFDQSYMRRMAAHHAQGIEIGRLGAERARDPHLRALARLMVADQEGEIAVFRQWWRSWFEGELPAATAADHATMPGMVAAADLAVLRGAEPFDARFIETMSFHHRGAVVMADAAIRSAGDVRLRLMAHATRHAQRGEIALMQGSQGWDAVRSAVANMLRPAGAAPVDGTTPPAHHR
jgi:uncharacterized protein (DUF305 family)